MIIPKLRKDLTGSVVSNTSVALGTLANKTGILLAGPAMTHGGGIQSIKMECSIQSLSKGDGPWLVGLANKDLTLAEIEEYLELGGPVSPSDLVGVKKTTRGRHLRVLGQMKPVGDGSVAAVFFKDMPLKGLRFNEDSAGWNAFLYNTGKAMSTGSTWSVYANCFVRWNP